MKRAELLQMAEKIVCKDRQTAHGAPENTFSLIAELWGSYLGVEVTAVDVGVLMVLLKIARLRGNPTHLDNFVDICGYSACAAEIATGG